MIGMWSLGRSYTSGNRFRTSLHSLSALTIRGKRPHSMCSGNFLQLLDIEIGLELCSEHKGFSVR